MRLLLLPTKKVRQKTKIKPGENPEFNETFNLKVPPGKSGSAEEEIKISSNQFRIKQNNKLEGVNSVILQPNAV